MKVIVQTPYYNKQRTLPQTVKDIPREMVVYEAKVLIIGDSSADRTVDVAKDIGVEHIVRNMCNMDSVFFVEVVGRMGTQ